MTARTEQHILRDIMENDAERARLRALLLDERADQFARMKVGLALKEVSQQDERLYAELRRVRNDIAHNRLRPLQYAIEVSTPDVLRTMSGGPRTLRSTSVRSMSVRARALAQLRAKGNDRR